MQTVKHLLYQVLWVECFCFIQFIIDIDPVVELVEFNSFADNNNRKRKVNYTFFSWIYNEIIIIY